VNNIRVSSSLSNNMREVSVIGENAIGGGGFVGGK
jgi:hypothetical protein